MTGATGGAFAVNLKRMNLPPDSRAPHLRLGHAAEDLAARFLAARGFQILARNLRCRAGEIDLAGLDGEVLAVVEVRCRRRTDFGGALASVTWRKQQKIIRAARYFLQSRADWRQRAMRFDVLAIEGTDAVRRIVWLKDAFRAAT